MGDSTAVISAHTCDVLIVGGGMVGLCLAHQLLERDITSSITVLDKEPKLGRHSSGRNSGVLHAGLYHKPDSVKAQVCVGGARRLRAWVEERGLPLNACGKLIVPPRPELDCQLDVLAERGRANGATLEFWDESQLRELIPEARSASGRALWSSNTVVVKPITVVRWLQQELQERGVSFLLGRDGWSAEPERCQLRLPDGDTIAYGHLINCAGAGRPNSPSVRGGARVHSAAVQGSLLAAQAWVSDSAPRQPLSGAGSQCAVSGGALHP